MQDGDWRLVYPGTDFTFGSIGQPVMNRTGPDLGDYEIRTSDADRPRSDGTAFGADYFGSRTISFDLWVRGNTEAEVRLTSGLVAKAWRADSIRATPGAVVELHVQERGSERIVFGRPRRFSPMLSHAHARVYATVAADFLCADDRFYSASESVVTVGIVGAVGGGFTFPLTMPFTTSKSSDRSVQIAVGGELSVWPVIEIQGPIVNPSISVVGLWNMAFNLNVAAGQTLTIDTRPWRRSILLNGGSAAGAISRASVRIGAASIPPGNYELALRGTSATGTATASVKWRNAFSTP